MKLVPKRDIRAAAGRVTICGFDGTEITAELREILREVRPAGLILFARNIESPAQVAELNRELKDLRGEAEPLLLAIDQEGGRVARVRAPATEWPPMRRLGNVGDPSLARRVGAGLGRELRAMSFDVDFAPVLDVDTNPDNPVIGDRSFSPDPAAVGRLGAALVQGLHDAGVAACGKHFPGHGDTDLDSHHHLPLIGHDLPRLREIEWPPFAAAIEAGVGAIMTAHVVVEVLDPDRPATLSARALAPLRDELGFTGVIISDGIEMKAVADRYTPQEIATYGLNAGVDLFLPCHPEGVLDHYRGLIHGVEQEEISHETLLAAAGRVNRWRRHFYRSPSPRAYLTRWVGCAEHLALVEEIENRAARIA